MSPVWGAVGKRIPLGVYYLVKEADIEKETVSDDVFKGKLQDMIRTQGFIVDKGTECAKAKRRESGRFKETQYSCSLGRIRLYFLY